MFIENNLISIDSDSVLNALKSISIDFYNPNGQIFLGATDDSRIIKKNYLFCAVSGAAIDGHQYIDTAKQKGATGFIISDPYRFEILKNESDFVVLVSDTRKAASAIASLFFGNPSDKLSVVGVTGTNGKTTTHWMVEKILCLLGNKTARIGTLGNVISDQSFDSNLTTPGAFQLHSFLAECVKQNVKYVSMEVSSHALEQKRVSDLKLAVAIFTNLSRDHLDYHGDMENYAEAKAKIFELLKDNDNKLKPAVINIDTTWANYFIESAKAKNSTIVTYGCEENSPNFAVGDIDYTSKGTSFWIQNRHSMGVTDFLKVNSPFIGKYNIENLLAAITAVVQLGFTLKEVIDVVDKIPQVPGRLEAFYSESKASVFVDYAHTPDALESALKALRPMCVGNLYVLFGCGGDRDKGKRPLMRKAAQSIANKIIVTSDNPRTENPEEIIKDIISPIEGEMDFDSNDKRIYIEVDREKAILYALSELEKDDILLIAGKGHEQYQIIGTEKKYFSDQEIVRKFLK